MAKKDAKMKEMHNWCCFGHGKKGFPTFWVIVLVLAGVWFLGELGVITFEFPWLAAIIVIVAIGALINHYVKKEE